VINRETTPVSDGTQDLVALSPEALDGFLVRIRTVECVKSDPTLADEGLSSDDIVRVREVCALGPVELRTAFTSLFSVSTRDSQIGVVSQPTYTCGLNLGIPSQTDLGVGGGNCIWHDSTPASCAREKGIACLWGCNNTDSTLGWHTRSFASKAALEKEIGKLGYSKIADWEGGDYNRQLAYGYRFQVHGQGVNANGKGTWHNEGPEPSPAFNWYAYLRNWWPFKVRDWHAAC